MPVIDCLKSFPDAPACSTSDVEMEDTDESSLHREARISKKRTVDYCEKEESGRVIVLNAKEGYLTREKGIDFEHSPWNDETNLLVWVENRPDLETAFNYFSHRTELTGGESPSLFGVEIEAYRGHAILSAEHFSSLSGKTVTEHWELFKERDDHAVFMRNLEALIAEGKDICTES